MKFTFLNKKFVVELGSIQTIVVLIALLSISKDANAVEATLDNVEPENRPIVELEPEAKLEGVQLFSRKGRSYSGFLGVPYGKIPRRFSISEPADKWKGTKVVNQLPEPCFQYSVFKKHNIGKEDCLHLNVYSPNLKGKFPVLVWIFPGGFQINGASMFEAKYFMDEDVVLVTIDHRLGALGFLDTTDGEVAGNMGMKDQVLAFQWVQKYISKFGGDSSLVTAIGLSAGGASVNYLLLSPMSAGLIHRGIAQSGSALNPWTLQYQPKSLYKQFANHAKCFRDTTEKTMQCLRDKTADELMDAQLSFIKYTEEFDFISMKFLPTIESPKAPEPRFLTDSPYNLMRHGKIANKVPYLTGITENEGSLYVAQQSIRPESIAKLDNEWKQMAPNLFYFEDVVDPSEASKVSDEIRKFYFEDKNITLKELKTLCNIYSDRLFNNGVVEAASLLSEHMPVYNYLMNYQGNHSVIQYFFKGIDKRNGVSHDDELMYMFNGSMGWPEMSPGTNDAEFSEKYIKLLVSFAKFGEPTDLLDQSAPWLPLNPKKDGIIQMYEIDLNSGQLLTDPFKSRREFWASLPLQENENTFNKNIQIEKEEL